jgi:uncharacterized protein (UPF0333 family)
MRCRGQLSLEYLILLAAVLAVFAMLLPLLSSIYSHGLFALDSINAKQFAVSMQQHVNEMRFQADGAIASFSVKPFNNWGIRSNAKQFFVAVPDPEGKPKEFAVDFPNEIELQPATLGKEKETQFTLQKGKKRAGEITLEYN